MSSSRHRPRTSLATALRLLAGVASVLALIPAAAAAAASISSNWAGYVSTPSKRVGSRFHTVSGAWTAPAATCTTGNETYSATWVGLGGDRRGADALEQIGTDTDCTRAGHARYSTWYELLPAGAVDVPMKITPGDVMSATVTVEGHHVKLRIRDITTGAHFTKRKRAAAIDVSSAEWIVEAPSACSSESSSSCEVLSLTNFGSVAFSSATATAGGHTGAIADADWRTTTELELHQRSGVTGAGHGAAAEAGSDVLAIPSAADAETGSFTVAWQRRAGESQHPSGPTLPGSEAPGA